jgi:hypothetical protein
MDTTVGRSAGATPAGVWASAGFFALGGVIEVVLGLLELPRPVPFWPAWETLGRSLLYFLVAAGLWRRIGLCRSIAMGYCLAALAPAVVLGLAFAHAPSLPTSVFVHSLYEVPSCAALPVLRSPRASASSHTSFRMTRPPPKEGASCQGSNQPHRSPAALPQPCAGSRAD